MTVERKRSRGASHWAMVIYDALWTAWEDGYHCAGCPGAEADGHGGCMGNLELLQYCEHHFNRSGTIQDHLRRLLSDKDAGVIIAADDLDYRDVVEQRIRGTRNHMRARGQVRNLGTKQHPVWVRGAQPKYWHPRTYVPGRFREYVPARADTELHSHVRKMAGGWPFEVRAELARAKPRPAHMRQLLAEALDLYCK